MRKAPAVVRRWKRVMAIGCTHGDLADPARLDEVIAFRDRFKPSVRFDLGDVMDTAAFRSGARGTKDESQPIAPDTLAAAKWIRRYEPTHLAWGNHDWRLVQWQGHPNAILSYAASVVWGALQDAVEDIGAETRPYDIEDGWFVMGGVHWGHGYMYNQSAVRDHAEMVRGGRVVIAHVHRGEEYQSRVIGGGSSFSVGLLGDPKKFQYARRRRATASWGASIVFGEMCEEESVLWMASARPGEPLRFPPGC